MAPKVADGGYTINLTASVMAGVRALEELCSQCHTATTKWRCVHVGPVDNNPVNNPIGRTLFFALEDGQRVEVGVATFRNLGERPTEQHKWFPCHVYVEETCRMLAFENHMGQEGYPWTRQPLFDKPLPGVTWRRPSIEEIAAYTAAVLNGDGAGFLKVYYSDLIDWTELNGSLGKSTGWVRQILEKVA